MKTLYYPLFGLLLLFLFVGCLEDSEDEEQFVCATEVELISMNQIQVVGSHNSYRIRPPEHIMQFLMLARDTIPPEYDPMTLDYTHLPLQEQLELPGPWT